MMKSWAKAVLCAALAAVPLASARADGVRAPLTSFGAAQSQTALSHFGFAAPASFSLGASPALFSYAGVPAARTAFAASLALSPNLAFDSGYNIDIAQRFGNYDTLKSPLVTGADFLALANGGTYAGVTWMLSPTVTLRAGAAERNDRLDRFSFDSASASLGLPLAYAAAQSRSVLAGVDWTPSDWGAIGLTAIQNSQSGVPFGFSSLSSTSHVDTTALDVAARFKLGNGWVTTASYAEGFTQLDQRAVQADSLGSYAIAIAKHGVFGDDAVGFSLSRPAPNVLNSGFDMVMAVGDLPPSFVASGHVMDQAPETDLQLGYVTNFLDGALALQANASYQMNFQGQTGATSLSVVSRAKIKF